LTMTDTTSRDDMVASPTTASRIRRSFPVPAIALIAIVLTVAIGPLLWTVSPIAQSSSRFAAASLVHPFGTDMYGRDLLARILTGGRWSLGGATTVWGSA
jgi:ABC-type dipeptide/oligopeptide/nickel transport system permease subunit